MSGLFPELEVELSLHPFDQKEVALPSCASAGPRKIHLCFQCFKDEGGEFIILPFLYYQCVRGV